VKCAVLFLDLINTKTGADETDEIKLKLRELATKTELKGLENKIIPPVDQFRVQIFDFKEELVQHNQTIRRFDEILCHKASKAAIQEVIMSL
jgi:hypothetical protein